MKRFVVQFLVVMCVGLGLGGCMGRNAMSKSIQDFNLETADSAWGRESMFLLTWPVAYVTNFLDLFIVNSIEFWSGTNPVNDLPALTDTPHDPQAGASSPLPAPVSGGLKELNVASLEGMGITGVASAQARYLDNEVLMYVRYQDGSREVFHAVRENGTYSFYRGKDLVLQVKEDDLKDLHAMLKWRMERMAGILAQAPRS